MTFTEASEPAGRRIFLRRLLMGGPLLGLGCPMLWSRFPETAAPTASARQAGPHKFHDDAHMTYAQVFDFAYKIQIIPLMIRLADEMGREKFVELLKSISPDVSLRTGDLWSELLTGVFWTHTLTREILEETDQVLRYNVTECLWAETWREASAGDIGYALFCFPDFARAQVMHRRLTRTKTLMQGDDVCDFTFELTDRA